jgi:S-adenosylmethionine:tRNA ribosyltransferase-isomerase
MKVDEFDYALPGGLVAQVPAPRRDDSRMLVLDRHSATVTHRRFRELPDLLGAADLLVVNDTRVRPARLYGRKASGGQVEMLVIEPVPDLGEDVWRALVRPAARLAPGITVSVDERLGIELMRRDGEAWIVRLRGQSGDPEAELQRCGMMPLPPYIHRDRVDSRSALDRERYQTVFAVCPGAVAAPTAGLHFTQEILAALEQRGMERAALTLHVGIGTFQPVRVDDVEQHRMHAEQLRIPQATVAAITACRERGGRIVAVGTTVVRALEAAAREAGLVERWNGPCDLFIYPGFRFQVVDAMITNFHLPRSTLLMLVAAFAGRESVLAAYREAVKERYRFFSYGDAMLIH